MFVLESSDIMNPPSSSAADKVADVLEDEVAGSVEVLEAAAAEVHRGLQTHGQVQEDADLI